MATSSLRQFQLTGVSDTGRTVGDGSYATVKELEFRGLKCVGKKIHQLLFDAARPQERAAMLQRFAEECELLSRVHHPCVVQFIGVYFEQGSQLPVLVMEYLHTTLSDYLTRYGVLPEAIGYGILRDVALGLRYLHQHSPPIIHRDLSANNVLLTSSLSAKISDLGVAKILNITPAQMTQRMSTQAPGTPCYMPPEALMARPTYTSKIDSYSYGVMIIHVLCGRWPFPADAFCPDPKNPDGLVPVSEVDRRAEYLRDISKTHPLVGLIHQCLSNFPKRRPEASEFLRQITDVMSRALLPHQSKMEMQTQIESLTVQVERLSIQNQDKQSQIESLTAQTQALMSQNKSLTAQTQALMSQNESLTAQTQALMSQNESLTAQTQALMSQNESLTAQTQAEVKAPRAEVERLSVRGPRREGESKQTNQPPRQQAPPSLPPRLPPQRPVQQPPPPPPPRPQPRSRPTPQPHLPVDLQSQPLLFHPKAKLCGRKVASLPVGMGRPQVVVVGETVCVGGGDRDSHSDYYLIFQYDPDMDKWTILPRCPLNQFGLGQLSGRLLTVGGTARGVISGKVYHYEPESQEWEEFLQSMPTARYNLSVISTQSAIIACGGAIGVSGGKEVPCTAVEVYTTQTSQWHTCTTDPLPIPCWAMSSATITNTGYLLGGMTTDRKPINTVLSASIPSLIQKATSHPQQSASAARPDRTSSAWKTLQDSPLKMSAAASLGGMLLTVGGWKDQEKSPAVHVYSPTTNSWIRVKSGDLPEPINSCGAIELSGNRLLVISGYDKNGERSDTVFLGSFTIGF